MKNINSLKAHEKDSMEDMVEKNEKLIKRVQNLEKENKRIKSENKTLEYAWIKTKEVILEIESGRPLTKLKRKCSNCSSKSMNKIQYDGFCVVACGRCGYRNRINAGYSE